MEYYRFILVIVILMILYQIIHKLLQRKGNTIEALSSEFTDDMNAMRILHGNDIKLPSYKVLDIRKMPNNISSSRTRNYNSNLAKLSRFNKITTRPNIRKMKFNKPVRPKTDIKDNDKSRNHLLKDLFFKASYNSAFTGKNMNIDMVELVISRGCRYIDFEVHKTDGYLYVSSVRLVDILSIINKSLIGTDPLFINLRLDSNIKSRTDFKGQIPENLRKLLYRGRQIDNTTRISEIQGKCVIITNINIPSISNIVSNCDNSICSYDYSEIIQFAGTQSSKNLTVVNPDNTRILSWFLGGIFNRVFNTNDANIEKLMNTYKTNIIPFQFYKTPKTSEFIFYETIFNDGNCTILPIKTLNSKYLAKLKNESDII